MNQQKLAARDCLHTAVVPADGSRGWILSWPHDLPEWGPHLGELADLRENGDCLTREEFDDLVGYRYILHCQSGRTELVACDELSKLASSEQFDIAMRIAEGEIATVDEKMGYEDFPADKEALLAEAEKAKAEVGSLTFSTTEHDLWYKR